jgi:hypothetical protein
LTWENDIGNEINLAEAIPAPFSDRHTLTLVAKSDKLTLHF